MNCLLVPPPPARRIIRTKLATDSGQTCRVKFPLSPVEHLQPRRRYPYSGVGDFAINSWTQKHISRQNEIGMLCWFSKQKEPWRQLSTGRPIANCEDNYPWDLGFRTKNETGISIDSFIKADSEWYPIKPLWLVILGIIISCEREQGSRRQKTEQSNAVEQWALTSKKGIVMKFAVIPTIWWMWRVGTTKEYGVPFWRS